MPGRLRANGNRLEPHQDRGAAAQATAFLLLFGVTFSANFSSAHVGSQTDSFGFMMPEAVLTDEHFEIFGRIIYGYAAAETGFKILLSAMTRTDLAKMLIITEPYSAKALRDVVQSIAHASTFEGKHEKDHLLNLLAEFKRLTKIRNSIAHFRWNEGTHSNAIRPISLDIRSGKAIPKGYEDIDPEYTMEELIDLANDAFELNNKLRKFIRENGYETIINDMMRAKDELADAERKQEFIP